MDLKYHKVMNNIEASDRFKIATLKRLEEEESRRNMKKSNKYIIGIAIAAVFIMGIFGFKSDVPTVTEMDLTERIEVDPNAISACAAVNFEGTIVKVGDDGLSFKLDTGKWVTITEETIIGITSPTAADKEDQFFEPTFRVGNMIAGFTENEGGRDIVAYAIYTNWNWEDPIR